MTAISYDVIKRLIRDGKKQDALQELIKQLSEDAEYIPAKTFKLFRSQALLILEKDSKPVYEVLLTAINYYMPISKLIKHRLQSPKNWRGYRFLIDSGIIKRLPRIGGKYGTSATPCYHAFRS